MSPNSILSPSTCETKSPIIHATKTIDSHVAANQVGLQCARNAKVSLAAYNKCARFDAGDEDDDTETISQSGFLSVAFEMLLAQQENAWRVNIAEKLTKKMFESRFTFVCAAANTR